MNDHIGLKETTSTCLAHQKVEEQALDTAGSSDIVSDDSDAADEAEEDFIFASMDEPKRALICNFIASHPFMKAAVQPVKLSDRRDFSSEICAKALSEGMVKGNVARFLAYVRRMYLYSAGVSTTPLDQHDEDIPWGQEVDGDTQISRRHSNDSVKMGAKKQTHTNGDTTASDRHNVVASDTPEFQDTQEFLNNDGNIHFNGLIPGNGLANLNETISFATERSPGLIREPKHQSPSQNWREKTHDSSPYTPSAHSSLRTSKSTPSKSSRSSRQRISTSDQFSTPPSKILNTKYPPLSPDPAEWDLDF